MVSKRFALVILLAGSCPGRAQTALSLQEALELALKQHPLLEAADARVGVTQGQRIQAGLRPNPMFVFQTENTRFHGQPGFVFWRDTDDFAYLQQTIETGRKRQRRVESAGEAVERAQREQDLLRRQISGRVALAYWNAAGTARLHALLVENNATFGQIVTYHEVRVKEGAMAEADLIRIQLEAQRLAITANQALLDAERARIQLFREMGQGDFPAVRFRDGIEGALEAVPEFDLAKALEQRPEARLARKLVEQARADERLQAAYARPNLDVIFGYKRSAGFNTMMGGIQMDLPLTNRNQGNIAAAGAEVRAAEASLAATQALIRAEVEAAGRDFEIRRRDIVTNLRPLLERAEETYRIAEAAYREGGSDLLRLLDAQRVRIEARIAYARSLMELRQSVVLAAMAMGAQP